MFSLKSPEPFEICVLICTFYFHLILLKSWYHITFNYKVLRTYIKWLSSWNVFACSLKNPEGPLHIWNSSFSSTIFLNVLNLYSLVYNNSWIAEYLRYVWYIFFKRQFHQYLLETLCCAAYLWNWADI